MDVASTRRSPFPDSARVLYSSNPLVEVICQLRFPSILRIDSEVPASFQERIRGLFPLFAEEESTSIGDLPPEFAQLVKATLLRAQTARKTWRFETEDSVSSIHLTREFVSLSTTQYSRWESFRSLLAHVVDALREEYRPSFLTRIGLRYQNLIVRSKLEMASVSWDELFKPHIAAEFCSPELHATIQEATHRILIELPYHQSKVNIRHGTARRQDDEESCYLIDNDFFTEGKTEVENALDRVDCFNRESGRLFRWCISDRLHEAMGPLAI